MIAEIRAFYKSFSRQKKALKKQICKSGEPEKKHFFFYKT